jgi:hypothetical protein
VDGIRIPVPKFLNELPRMIAFVIPFVTPKETATDVVPDPGPTKKQPSITMVSCEREP